MPGEASNGTTLIERVSRLEQEVERLRAYIQSLGVPQTGETKRPGEYELTRGLAPSSRP